MTDALRRCDAYLDAVATLAADVVDVGPLRAFVSRAPYAYYVRPIPGVDLSEPGSVSREQVREAAAVLTDALAEGKIDAAFMPVDEERKRRIAFGPAYVPGESNYMVTAATGAKTA